MPDLPPELQCACEASCFHTSTLLLPRYLHVLLVLTTRLWTTLAHLSCSLFATKMIGLLNFFGSLNITTSLIVQFGAVLFLTQLAHQTSNHEKGRSLRLVRPRPRHWLTIPQLFSGITLAPTYDSLFT